MISPISMISLRLPKMTQLILSCAFLFSLACFSIASAHAQDADQVAPKTSLAPSAMPTQTEEVEQASESRTLQQDKAPSVASQEYQTRTSTRSSAPKAKAASAPRPSWFGEQDAAVKQARNGNTKDALVTLRRLYQQHGDNQALVRDYLAVLAWDGGHDQEVVTLYRNNIPNDTHDYVLAAVGKAYRNIGQPDDARAIYEKGLSIAPSSDVYAAGLIHSVTEAGYAEEALKISDANLDRYGQRLEVLLAAGHAADMFDQNNDAIRYYEAAARMAPQNTQAVEGLARAYSRAGKPELALKLADEHPGIISQDEYRFLQSDVAANLIRDGQSAPTEAERFTMTDRAITMLNSHIEKWTAEGPEAKKDVIRERLDRVIALRNRNQMQEVVVQYQKLREDHITIPPYVLSAVGDAYMYLHQPEEARDIFVEVLKSDPKNYNVRRQLVYAYAECNQYREAYEVADSLAADQPYWTNIEGQKNPAINPRRANAELLAGAVRTYAGEVSDGGMRIIPVTAAAPEMASAREALGNLYQLKGWPRQALAQYRTATQLNGGQYIGAEVGEAASLLQTQHYREAEAKTNELAKRAPENLAVQRAVRDQQIYNMAELRVTAGYQFRPDSSNPVTGGEAYGIDTIIYSPPINYNWRIFAGEYYTHQNEPNNEGSIGFSRTTVGAQYRNGNWNVGAGPTYNHYKGTERIGVAGDVTYAIDDQWTVAGSGEKFSRDTPLRAMNSRTTADFIGGHATWRRDETQKVRFGGNIMPFSDGNVRTALDADLTQQLYTAPGFRLEGLAAAAESQNTADTNRSYYNPGRDFIVLAGPRAIHTIYQRYSTMWQHSLTVQPGVYWEERFGSDAAFRARYEHRLFLANTFEAGAGFNFGRQSYDGTPENNYSITFDLTDRF